MFEHRLLTLTYLGALPAAAWCDAFINELLNHNAYIKTQLLMYANDKKILKLQGSWDIINLADVFEKYRQKRNELVVFIIRSAFVGKSFA